MEFRWQHAVVCMSVLLAIQVCCIDDAWVLRKHSGWNKLILVHQWPVTVCEMVEKHCEHLPNYWTLHGLWPDKTDMCNTSWPLDLTNIQDLLAEMNKWWPDIIHPNCSDFWKHEWIKHGTCAATLSCLDSQHKYFSKGLELYSSVDLNSVLEKYGIVPSKTYQVKEIKDAIWNAYGIMPKIQCLAPHENSALYLTLWDFFWGFRHRCRKLHSDGMEPPNVKKMEPSEDTQTLGQIELCFTKEFKMENCTHAEEIQGDPHMKSKSQYLPLHVCEDGLIFYPPVEQ